MIKVAVIDSGIGNVRSVANAVEAVGGVGTIVSSPDDIKDFGHIILPGVGAFGNGMKRLQDGGWIDPLEEAVLRGGNMFLGICLGMQVLSKTGTEHGVHPGLGWLGGNVEQISTGEHVLRVPHIGWNDVKFTREHPLFDGLRESEVFYFIHSYVFNSDDRECVAGVCSYGEEFAAIIAKDNILATQFHPEKSQKAGLKIIENFLKIG